MAFRLGSYPQINYRYPPVIKRRGAPRPRRIFPLGLRGKAVRPFSPAFIFVMNSCTSFHETYSTGQVGQPGKIGRVAPHHRLPLGLGHFRGLHVKRLRQRHLMLRFITVPSRLVRRASHGERARRDQDEGLAKAVGVGAWSVPILHINYHIVIIK